jgi:hypothetical protein
MLEIFQPCWKMLGNIPTLLGKMLRNIPTQLEKQGNFPF